jgi:hypothetical protein
MDSVLRFLGVLLVAALGLTTPAESAFEDREEILIGRIAHVEGDLLRYVPAEKDWVLTVVDAPFGLEDTLYAGEGARAELILPNATWLRIGEQTQVQMLDLVADTTSVDIASGQARLYSNSGTTMLKATTPFGFVVAPPGSAFDLYVGDDSLEVIAVRGELNFIHDATGQRYPLRVGGASLIADRQGVSRGNGTVAGDWDDWNGERESLWARRQQGWGAASDLVPEPIRHEAYALEENGRWERVYYDGAYRDMWRPIRVVSGWQPFTVGRWVDYYGDNCWIPDEPFGYLTHHYGAWIFVDAFRAWYWLPPVVRRPAISSSPLLGFGWSPGRVGWFSRGAEIGWVVLAPNEDYYGYRHWGNRTRVARHHGPMINPARYRYIDHALVVDRDRLYRRHRGPHDFRRESRSGQMGHQFKPITVWHEFKDDKRRHSFSDRRAGRKPHELTLKRIHHNQQHLRSAGRLDRQRLEQDLRRFPVNQELPRSEERQRPRLRHSMVDADKTVRPIDRSVLPQKEIKPRERERWPLRDSRSVLGSRGDRQSGWQSAIDPRRDPAQPRTNPGTLRWDRALSPQHFGDGLDRIERQEQSDRQRRDNRPPLTREQLRQQKTPTPDQAAQEFRRDRRLRGPEQAVRRQQLEGIRQQPTPERGESLERDRNALNTRQEEQRRQLELKKRREEAVRQQWQERQGQERRGMIGRQQGNEDDRLRRQRWQMQQQPPQELLRRPKDQQQQGMVEQRRYQEEQPRREKREQRRQLDARQNLQREDRQRQDQLRQGHLGEQPRLRQRPTPDSRELREHNQQFRKKRPPFPGDEEQAGQPI